MRLLTLAFMVLTMTGCMRVVFGDAVTTASQANADLNEAAHFIRTEAVERQDYPTAMAAEAVQGHATNIANAMRIDKSELPKPRVTSTEWKQDPNKAYDESRAHVKDDGVTLQRAATIGFACLSIAMVGVKLGHVMLKAHPVVGPLFGTISTLFGYSNPVKDSAYKKVFDVLEAYKEFDPKWREHKIYEMLSSALLQKEKEFIKAQRNA